MKQSSWSRSVILSVCGCSLWGLVGCGVTDTGNPYGDDDTGGEATNVDGCDQIKSAIELDAQTALGFNARAVVDLVGGEHAETLLWIDSSGTPFGPESGRSELTLSVEPLGTGRFIDRSVPTNSGAGPAIEIAPLDGCRDSVEIDVRLQLTTAGGALAETIDTVLEAAAPDFASGRFTIDLTEVMGSFEAEPVAPANSELTRSKLTGQLGFSEYGAVGAISLQSEFRSLDGSAVGQGGAGEIAHFPADNYCGQPNAVSVLADQPVRGLSLATALEALNIQGSVPVQYASGPGSELELQVTSGAERVCISFDRDPSYIGEPGGAALSAPASVHLSSADGRLEADIPVQLLAQAGQAGLLVSAESRANTEDVSPAQLLERYGVQDQIDFSAYDGASAYFRSQASGTSKGGELLINGLDVPQCLSNPEPIDPNATSAPGCSGIEQVPVWTARWGTLD
jgi:hypothetical protein